MFQRNDNKMCTKQLKLTSKMIKDYIKKLENNGKSEM